MGWIVAAIISCVFVPMAWHGGYRKGQQDQALKE